jgi:hypothetical protein
LCECLLWVAAKRAVLCSGRIRARMSQPSRLNAYCHARAGPGLGITGYYD